jgi:hypothetical protein
MSRGGQPWRATLCRGVPMRVHRRQDGVRMRRPHTGLARPDRARVLSERGADNNESNQPARSVVRSGWGFERRVFALTEFCRMLRSEEISLHRKILSPQLDRLLVDFSGVQLHERLLNLFAIKAVKKHLRHFVRKSGRPTTTRAFTICPGRPMSCFRKKSDQGISGKSFQKSAFTRTSETV